MMVALHKRRRRASSARGKKSEPTRDVFLCEREGMTCEHDQRIQNRAPRDTVLLDPVIKVSSSDKVLGQREGAICWLPQREGPVAEQFCKRIGTPLRIGRGSDIQVGGRGRNFSVQLPNQFLPIVQSSIPSENCPGGGYVRLHFVSGFLRYMESSIEDAKVAFAEVAFAVRAIWSKDDANLFEIRLVHGPSVEIYLSKLGAHRLDLPNPATANIGRSLHTSPAYRACHLRRGPRFQPRHAL